jgi:hypothetical protein
MDADEVTFHWAQTDKATRQICVHRAKVEGCHAVWVSDGGRWVYVGTTDAPWNDREALTMAAIEVVKLQAFMGADAVSLKGPPPP